MEFDVETLQSIWIMRARNRANRLSRLRYNRANQQNTRLRVGDEDVTSVWWIHTCGRSQPLTRAIPVFRGCVLLDMVASAHAAFISTRFNTELWQVSPFHLRITFDRWTTAVEGMRPLYEYRSFKCPVTCAFSFFVPYVFFPCFKHDLLEISGKLLQEMGWKECPPQE